MQLRKGREEACDGGAGRHGRLACSCCWRSRSAGPAQEPLAGLDAGAGLGPAGAARYDRSLQVSTWSSGCPEPPRARDLRGLARAALRARRRPAAHRPAGVQLRRAEQPAGGRLRHGALPLLARARREAALPVGVAGHVASRIRRSTPGCWRSRGSAQFLPGYLLDEQRKVAVSGEGRELDPDVQLHRSRQRGAQRLRRAARAGRLRSRARSRATSPRWSRARRRPPRHGNVARAPVLRAHAAALQPARRRAGAGDHAVPPRRAPRVPRGRDGTPRKTRSRATSRACGASTASTCSTTRTSPRSAAARPSSTTARTSRPPMRAASSRRPSRTRRKLFADARRPAALPGPHLSESPATR